MCMCVALFWENHQEEGFPKTEEDEAEFHFAVESKILIQKYSQKITERMLVVWHFFVSCYLFFFLRMLFVLLS